MAGGLAVRSCSGLERKRIEGDVGKDIWGEGYFCQENLKKKLWVQGETNVVAGSNGYAQI